MLCVYWISSGVAWPGDPWVNSWVMMARRSAMSMSMVDGFFLCRYQGALRRRSPTFAAGLALIVYQTVIRLWQYRVNGTVLSTAFLTRLRASPTPMMFFASKNATSRDQRAAYRAMMSSAVAVSSVLTIAMS